jgi:hypothetical protein
MQAVPPGGVVQPTRFLDGNLATADPRSRSPASSGQAAGIREDYSAEACKICLGHLPQQILHRSLSIDRRLPVPIVL